MSGKTITLLDDSAWPSEAFAPKLPISRERAALGVIDMQHYCNDPTSDLAHSVKKVQPQLHAEYEKRLKTTIENNRRLLAAFRESDYRVIFTRHGMQIQDGRDLVLRRRGREEAALSATDEQSGHLPLKGTHGHEILPELQPRPGELILDENTSSAFHSSPIDLYLRNMGVDTLVLTGVASDQCVFATALDAADRGFHVIIVWDACNNLDPGSAEAVHILFGRVWGYVMDTDSVLHWLETGDPPSQTQRPAQG